PWVSFFYAHLERLDFEQDKWLDVNAGAQLGTVGKTGNARGPNVQPHLHLELIVQTNRRSAMDERHLGRDQSSVAAAEHFAAALEDTCLEPLGLMPKSKQVARARRVDPFLALVCLTPEKPRFAKAPSPLESASLAWSELYLARDFNVNGTARR
ncbi:MAG TPA: M23 family metallopeptidase, partial [Polyangiaceae bacterium]|nr:M23 family metallopeptidase [Polyangiaceae bacterium]